MKKALFLFVYVTFIGLAAQRIGLAVESPTLVELSSKTRAARLAGDNSAWLEFGQRTLALAPDHPDLLISVARALAANGRVQDSAQHLRNAIDRGAGFDLDSFPEFARISKSESFESLAQQALQNMTPVPRAIEFTLVEDPNLRPEGISFDSKTGRLFIGSARGEIWQIDQKGKMTRFVSGGGLREVYGLKVDVDRRILWAVTGVFPDLFPSAEPKKDVGIAGVQSYDLDTGKQIRACWLDERPILHGFNDLALASNGDLYVTDSARNAVYRLPQDRNKFELLIRDDRISFPNGIVLSPDQKRLFVAHVEGISAIDIRSRQIRKLSVPRTTSVNSIDGLAWDQGDLLGIQGSPYLSRIIRIRLSPDGLSVNDVSILNSHTPRGYSQTTGVVVDRDFIVVAGLQPVRSQNAPQPDSAPSRILRIPLILPAN